jgi:hypothetical protein
MALLGLLPLVSRKQYERDRRVPGDSELVAGLLILRRCAEEAGKITGLGWAHAVPRLMPGQPALRGR